MVKMVMTLAVDGYLLLSVVFFRTQHKKTQVKQSQWQFLFISSLCDWLIDQFNVIEIAIKLQLINYKSQE